MHCVYVQTWTCPAVTMWRPAGTGIAHERLQIRVPPLPQRPACKNQPRRARLPADALPSVPQRGLQLVVRCRAAHQVRPVPPGCAEPRRRPTARPERHAPRCDQELQGREQPDGHARCGSLLSVIAFGVSPRCTKKLFAGVENSLRAPIFIFGWLIRRK